MTSDIKPAEDDQLPERPMQFTLRQALLAVGLLCVILALFRAVGVEIGTGFLIASGLTLLSVIALVRRQWLLATFPLLVLLAVFGHLLPAVSSGSPSKRIMCSSTLKNIAQFLLDYHHRKGAFPPAYVADNNGRPMHSWRVLILPDIDPNLYAQYRFDEPWDGSNNSKLASLAENPFRCPSDVGDGSEHDTSYVVVVGPKTAFPGDKCVALSDITDDHGNTILVVEVANSGIHWMEPRDLHVTQMARTINPAMGQGISSKHHDGANVVMADGSVQFLSAEKVTVEEVQSLLTIDGNEPPPNSQRQE